MNVQQLGPLRVRRVVVHPEKADKTAQSKALTVVLLHGFGAPGDDLVGLAGAIGAPPGTTFVFPAALHSLSDFVSMPMYGDARAWWMIDVGRFERAIAQGSLSEIVREVPPGLVAAREALQEMLDALVREGTPPERIVLGGFSQGAMLSTDLMLRTETPFAGLVILSGAIVAEDEWLPGMKRRAGLRVFQSHGTGDPILPYEVAKELHATLEEAGLDVSFTSFQGGHGIPPTVLRDLGTWLSEVAK